MRSSRITIFSAASPMWFIAAFVLLIPICWLAQVGPAPYGDDGGYQHILLDFIHRGKVDYMQWSLATLIGILPFAAGWCSLFGYSSMSFDCFGAAFGVLFLVGLLTFLRRLTGAVYALLLTACMYCFNYFVIVAPTFMTDVPTLCFFIGFLLQHYILESRAFKNVKSSNLLLWIGWTACCFLTMFTRCTFFILVPIFCLQFYFANNEQRRFALRCMILSACCMVAAILIESQIGENREPPIEFTCLPQLFIQHDWARFDLRCFGTSVLTACGMASPALLLSEAAMTRKITVVDLIVAVLSLAAGLHFWLKGLLDPFSMQGLSIVFPILAAFGVTLTFRLVRSLWGKAQTSTTTVVTGILVVHFAMLPFMAHPVLRHVMPAYLSIICLVALSKTAKSRLLTAMSLILLLTLSLRNIELTEHTRRVDNAIWTEGNSLLVNKVAAIDDIACGWSWFCFYHLHPGIADHVGFRKRFSNLQKTARFEVSTHAPQPSERLIKKLTISTFDCQSVVYVTERL